MRIKIIIISFLIAAIISSCGISKDDYNKLESENAKLKVENEKLTADLDECKFGAEKIIAAVENAYVEKNYKLAKQNISLLYEKHPESPKNIEYKEFLIKLEKEEMEYNLRKEAEEKERIRLANLNNTGMWKVSSFVDEFGRDTNKKLITNSKPIEGTFSNSATSNSKLRVDFIIENSKKMAIQLYEYGKDNPVKSSSPEWYIINVLDKDGKKTKIKGFISLDRIKISDFDLSYNDVKNFEYHATNLHNIFKKGGQVKFVLYPEDYPTTEYKFEINNADYYENAYRILKEK